MNMKKTYETLMHQVVVGPVILLAGLIDAATGLSLVIQQVVDRMSGDLPRRRTGTDGVPTA